jgi:uroporphyrin-III C-methyltransferase
MTVHLVGAGPGDPELLTVRALRLLSAADVVLHDRLVSEETLARVRPGAVLIDVGKEAGGRAMPQAEINRLLVEHGRTGEVVVRLKGGDPYVFGRGGEEAQALLEAGIQVEVVPGISSAIAAATAAGVPVTMRNQALAFTVVTGHEDPNGSAAVDWEAHVATGATLVILMGAARIGVIAERLLGAGMRPETPVVAVRAAFTPRQEVIRTTLAEVGSAGIRSPSTIVIGEVAALDLHTLPIEH